MQQDEEKWSVTANGKAISNGTTIRNKYGRVAMRIVSKTEDRQSQDSSTKNNFSADVNMHGDSGNIDNSKKKDQEINRPTIKVNTSGIRHSNEALATVIQQLKWREYKGNGSTQADMYWHGVGFDENTYNKTGVYAVNKLPGICELSQKIHLSRIIKRMQMLFPGEFDFYPSTWFLPEQYHQFVAEVACKNKTKTNCTSTKPPSRDGKQRKDVATYIVKPDTGSQGEGIYLVIDPRDVQEAIGNRPAVVQRYIDNPLLLDGYKFDLRIYVLVARIQPIEIYLCKEGLARLCTIEYEHPNPTNIHDTLMHLTNYSLNKNSEDFIYTTSENTGSKRTYRSVKQTLKRQGHDVDKIHKQIIDLAVKTILSLLPDVTLWNHVANKTKLVRSFQILGFDILLTSDLKAHLLEVNSSPSMGIDGERETEPGSGIMESVTSVVDEQIKVPLLRDSLKLIAYGENELDMEKSCLERVYPPPSKSTNKKPTRHHSIPETIPGARNVKIPRIVSDEVQQRTEQKKLIEDITSTKNPYSQDRPIIGRSWDESRIEPSNINESFENPLNNPELLRNRLNYLPRTPKKFTVVKYRQEYAISTEDWRLFGPSRTKQFVPTIRRSLKQMETNSCHTTPRKYEDHSNQCTPRSKSMTTLPLTSHHAPVCRLCGSYLDGAGPGLYFVQQNYKASQETSVVLDNEERRVKKLEPWGDTNSAWPQDRLVNTTSPTMQSYDTEETVYSRKPMPPRSFYFNSAQKDDAREMALHRQSLRRIENEVNDVIPRDRSVSIAECLSSNDESRLCESCTDNISVTSSESEKLTDKKGLSFYTSYGRECSRNFTPKSTKPAPKVIKPTPNAFAMREIMILNRVAAIFIYFNGIKSSLRISATAFRNMARKCGLCEQGAMPAIDILFIDTMRQWQNYAVANSTPFYDSFRGKGNANMHHTSGLPFQGFIEALFRLAKARFKGSTLKEKMENLVQNCEVYIKEANRADKAAKRRIEGRSKKKIILTPRISGAMSQRQPFFNYNT